jgi:hypothetical protein
MAYVMLSWEQLTELKKIVDVVESAHDAGAVEGDVHNEIIRGQWDANEVKITLEI